MTSKQIVSGVRADQSWQSRTIGEISVKVGSGITPTGGERVYRSSGRPFVRSQNVGWGKLELSDVAFIDEETHKSFASTEIADGDVLLNITGASIGRVACADSRLAGGNVNQHVCIIRVDQRSVAPRFLTYLLLSRIGQSQIDSFQAGGNRQGLNFSQVRSISFSQPPIEEQHAIAGALKDVDALIDGLQLLIKKKRDIKRATMQQLLTGQVRLPGFTGSWQSFRLGDSATLKARIGWQGLTTAEYQSVGEHYLVTGTELLDGTVEWNSCSFVSKERYDQDRNIQLRPGDVLVTKDGTIGKAALVRELPRPATLNSGVFVIRPLKSAFAPGFLFRVLTSIVFDEFLSQLAAGSTINHLYQKDFVHFLFSAPPTIEEQETICKVLDDMDHELTVLGTRLTKLKELKQGMMQQLLTGKVRLV